MEGSDNLSTVSSIDPLVKLSLAGTSQDDLFLTRKNQPAQDELTFGMILASLQSSY
jgi:hypothetical protein